MVISGIVRNCVPIECSVPRRRIVNQHKKGSAYQANRADGRWLGFVEGHDVQLWGHMTKLLVQLLYCEGVVYQLSDVSLWGDNKRHTEYPIKRFCQIRSSMRCRHEHYCCDGLDNIGIRWILLAQEVCLHKNEPTEVLL